MKKARFGSFIHIFFKQYLQDVYARWIQNYLNNRCFVGTENFNSKWAIHFSSQIHGQSGGRKALIWNRDKLCTSLDFMRMYSVVRLHWPIENCLILLKSVINLRQTLAEVFISIWMKVYPWDRLHKPMATMNKGDISTQLKLLSLSSIQSTLKIRRSPVRYRRSKSF